jgi:hypothetical protein
MMDKAIKEMTIRGMDLTYLHSRRAMDGHYTKFGYYGINRYNSLEILSLISNSNENALRFSAFKECNLDRIRKYYDQSYSSLSGSIVRDEKIWQFLISRINASPEHFNLLECNLCESDELIGYVLVSGDKLIELSLPAAYFNHLPLALRTARIKFISIHPFHPYYRFVRTSYSTILHERISLDGGYMGKILSPFFLISKLSMGICQKAREIGVDGENVRIAGYEIDLRSGQILEATQPDDVTFEKQGHLIRFILGMHQCSQYDGIKINKDKPWIEYLFPSSGFHTSAFDEI